MNTDGLVSIFRHFVQSGDTIDRAIKDLGDWVPEEKLQAARKEYERLPAQIRRLDPSTTLKDPRLEKTLWYAGPGNDDHYWPALKQALIQKGWKSEAIELLDRSS